MNYVDIETYNTFLHKKEKQDEKVIIYCRVSSPTNKSNLETQKERLINYLLVDAPKPPRLTPLDLLNLGALTSPLAPLPSTPTKNHFNKI